MLTAKQKRFCEEYVIDLNATQAAIRAGYSKRSASSIGEENLRKPEIIKYIEELQEELRKKAGLTADMVIDDLRSMAEWNIQDFLASDNTIVDLTTLPRKKTRAVIGIKSKTETRTIGETTVVERTVELKFADKRAAIVDLGRHTGIFEKDNMQKPAVATPSQSLSDDQFSALLKTINNGSQGQTGTSV